MYKILDIFSGAGGFSYGIEMNNSFETVIGLDFNEKALKTFKNNHKKAITIYGDITKEIIKKEVVKKSKETGVNMIIGGPPCQGFSLKGKKLGLNDPRNFLFMEFFNLVKRIEPKIFILENVKAMISAAEGFFIKEIIDKFKGIGYEVNFDVLLSSDFGVPQKRQRAFVIGSKEKIISFPKNTSEKIVTIKEAISDLSYLESGESSSNEYKFKPQSEYQKLMRENSDQLTSHKATNHSELAIKKMSLIPVKGNKFDMPLKFRGNQKFNTTWSRLHWDKVSPTIDTRFDTPSNGQNIHPELNRAITPREAARIQSFPDAFKFIGNKTSICRQIGNAVPPLMAKAIADQIIIDTIDKSEYQGNIRIVNDDAFNAFVPENIDAIITDPPYNISKKNNFGTMNNKRAGVDFGEWDKGFDLTGWIDRYYDKLNKGGTIIIFTSYLYLGDISRELEKNGALVKDVIKWTKTNPMPRNISRRYVQDTEFAIWAVKPGKWVFNRPDDKYLRAQFSSATVLGKERTAHPTQKSLKLMKELIKIHTNKNDLIVDPFMGSGTTGKAAKILRRKFYGIEKEKKYYEISKKRILS